MRRRQKVTSGTAVRTPTWLLIESEARNLLVLKMKMKPESRPSLRPG
jgi:hypothetical protein